MNLISCPWSQLAWLQVAVQTTNICVGFRGITGTDINTALSHMRTTDPLMALSGCTEHEPWRGLPWLHMPLTSAWLPETAKPKGITKGIRQWHRPCMSTMISGFILTWSNSMDHQLQHSFLWHRRPRWCFEEVYSRRWTFSRLGPLLLPRARGSHKQGQVQGLSLCLLKLQGCCKPFIQPCWTMTTCRSQPSEMSLPSHLQFCLSP